jgi:hypothetical protein
MNGFFLQETWFFQGVIVDFNQQPIDITAATVNIKISSETELLFNLQAAKIDAVSGIYQVEVTPEQQRDAGVKVGLHHAEIKAFLENGTESVQNSFPFVVMPSKFST